MAPSDRPLMTCWRNSAMNAPAYTRAPRPVSIVAARAPRLRAQLRTRTIVKPRQSKHLECAGRAKRRQRFGLAIPYPKRRRAALAAAVHIAVHGACPELRPFSKSGSKVSTPSLAKENACFTLLAVMGLTSQKLL